MTLVEWPTGPRTVKFAARGADDPGSEAVGGPRLPPTGTAPMTELPEFFALDRTCSNCGRRFTTRARDGHRLCHACWGELDVAVRSIPGTLRRRCA